MLQKLRKCLLTLRSWCFIDLILTQLKKGPKYLFDEFSKIVDEIFGAGKKVDELPRTKAEKRVLAKKEAREKRLQEKNRGKTTQKGGGDINKSFAENAGIKTEKWLTELSVIGQTTDYTCAATSLRMILEERNIIRGEEFLATALKTDKNGASILDIPDALYHNYLDDVTAIAEKEIELSKLLEKLEDGDKAIVSIGTDEFPGHAVVLEKVENGKVFLRDPLPINHGSSYSMKIQDFKKIFNERAVIIKK